jgi:DNA end-binding protein Ku
MEIETASCTLQAETCSLNALEILMPSSVWTGYLTFGLISMPVRLFSGARGSRVSFHMLHRDDMTRIKQQLYCPTDERVVERSEIVKGYEYRKGEYVVIEPEEIKKIEPKTAKSMEILEFVKDAEVDPIYYESSYYLMPEEAGKRPYVLLARALEDTNTVAIAKLTMHNREYTVILRPYKNGILLHTMYYADEVRQLENFGEDNVEVKEGEVKIAHQLIRALEGKFQPEKFHDTFEDNVKALIKAHLEGKEVVAIPKPKPAPVTDLMAALKQSLAQMEKKKPAARVTDIREGSQTHVKGGRKKAAGSRKKAA